MNALSGDISSRPQIHNRIQKYAAEHPEATEYLIVDAIMASELLLAMAATIQLAVRNNAPRGERNGNMGPFKVAEMRKTANQMRKAVVDGDPFTYIQTLGELEIFGLKLVFLNPEDE